jgi:uncharacterized cofD-like protein
VAAIWHRAADSPLALQSTKRKQHLRIVAVGGGTGLSMLLRNQMVALQATLQNGKIVQGETRIGRSRSPIRRVQLVPRSVRPLPEALEAFASADLILLGPGSLYTSILPNLLVRGVVEAMEKSRAPVVYIANLMTQPGETAGLTLDDHVRAIHQHTGRKLIDWVVLNNAPIAPEMAKRYRAQGAEPVSVDTSELQRMGLRILADNLLEVHGVIRHNAARLASLLLENFAKRERPRHRKRAK